VFVNEDLWKLTCGITDVVSISRSELLSKARTMTNRSHIISNAQIPQDTTRIMR